MGIFIYKLLKNSDFSITKPAAKMPDYLMNFDKAVSDSVPEKVLHNNGKLFKSYCNLI